jgi:hypothetical protein
MRSFSFLLLEEVFLDYKNHLKAIFPYYLPEVRINQSYDISILGYLNLLDGGKFDH